MPDAIPSFQSAVVAKLGMAMVGLAALFTAGAQADIAVPSPADGVDGMGPASQELAQILIRQDGGKVYISENGTAYRELALRDTPDGVRLKKLLNELDLGPEPMAVPVGRMIVADGGAGVHAPKEAERPNDAEQKSADRK
jgi:hypothetical protein